MWTCIECENEYTHEIDGDAEERMCFECLDTGYCEWCYDSDKKNLYDNGYGLYCDEICALKSEFEKYYYHKYKCTDKSNDKVYEMFTTMDFKDIEKLADKLIWKKKEEVE